MAKATKDIIEATTTESAATVNPDLETISKMGQAANARKAFQVWQRACIDYGKLVAKCGPAVAAGARNNKSLKRLRTIADHDTSSLSRDEGKRLDECIKVKNAMAFLTGQEW